MLRICVNIILKDIVTPISTVYILVNKGERKKRYTKNITIFSNKSLVLNF